MPSNLLYVFQARNAFVCTGHESQRILRNAYPVCNHPMQENWLATLDGLIYERLDSCGVKWSSIDPVRFAEAGKKDVNPLHLWIGVIPGTLVFDAAKAAAEGCKDILVQVRFPDVEVAFREPIVTRSVGPKLLDFNPAVDPIPDLRSPFTPMLGIQIVPVKTPYYEAQVPSVSARVTRAIASSFLRPVMLFACFTHTRINIFCARATASLTRRLSPSASVV